jgi:tetratricopeptide (TPR) repeat protein
VACMCYMLRGEPLKLAQVSPKVINALENEEAQRDTTVFGRGNAYVLSLGWHSFAMGLLGRFSEAEALNLKNVGFAEETGNAFDMAWAEECYGTTSLYRGEWDKATVYLEKSIRHVREAQASVVMGAPITCMLAHAYSHMGEAESAQASVQQALQMQQESPLANAEHIVLWQVGCAELNGGNRAPAIAHLQRALEVAQAKNITGYKGAILISLGTAIGEADLAQSQKAEEYVLQGIHILDESEMRPFAAQGRLFLAELYAKIGEKAKALHSLTQARGMFQEMGMDYWLARTEKALEKLQEGGR